MLLPQARERMIASFARGDLAAWSYDAAYAEAAADARRLLPDARSVVCIAVRYATPSVRSERGRGRVSNYAWSADYHRRMQAILADLAARLTTLGGRCVVACDTSPLAERAFAERAGLGWIGKHTNLIVRGHGSFVFLGEVVTTLELPVDQPIRTSCGSCTRCVQACPTNALRGDYTIDARRCISDLTQRRGTIPRELRPMIGEWIWGCDLCQEACPPTRRAPFDAVGFAPRDAQTAAPPLQALLTLNAAQFRERFGPTAMGWRGAAILRRNAAIALGNGLDRADVPALAASLSDDPARSVREHAAWALGRIGSPAAVDALRAALARERDPRVRTEIVTALEAFSQNSALH